MNKKVILKINKKGEPTLIDMVGFGSTCVEAFQPTLKKLGGAIGVPHLTEEYVKPVETDISVEQ